MKTFLILTDLDSTFEEFEMGKGEFIIFEKLIQKFEKRFGLGDGLDLDGIAHLPVNQRICKSDN